MQPVEKKSKKYRKAGGKGQPVKEAANNLSNIDYSSYYGEQGLVDYEPESPAIYLGDEGDMSPDGEYWPAQEEGPATIMQPSPNFPRWQRKV